jgi:DNA-binding transcriptional regulator YhcF (GntR family)
VTSPVPPYEQLREQIAGLIATGRLQAGQRLPPVRQVAADLGLAGGTVARAYRELAQAGLVEGGGRHGTVVRSGARPWPTISPARRHCPARPITSPASRVTLGLVTTRSWPWSATR